MDKKGKTTKECKYCKSEISINAKICPQCRKRIKGGKMKWILIAIVVIMIFSAVGSSEEEVSSDVANSIQNVEETAINSVEKDKVNTKEEIVSNVIEESQKFDSEDTAEESENIPTEYKSALSKAKTYSDMMYMSKQSIYEQLTSEYGEKFSEEAAAYAMENLNVDYKENALKKAESYSDTMYMSKRGIYDQLISEYGEKFTEEEAQYAIDNLKTDYKRNALKSAHNYQETLSMSPAAIYDQLISEYGEKFTEEEAQYAIDNLE